MNTKTTIALAQLFLSVKERVCLSKTNLRKFSFLYLQNSKEGFTRSQMQRTRAKRFEITLEDTECERFQENKLPILPNNAEPAQLLKNVSMKMKFRPSFLKYWMPVVRSEASCAILIDSFWYMLMTYFKV
jgi:hypothetical protein